MSRTLLLVLVVTLGPALTAHADVAEATRAFDEGNRHYAVGNYQGAITSYHDALETGFASTALYYNLGNANYRLDRLGEAILYYERARRMAPRDPEIVHNLSITRDRTQDRFSRLPTPYWQQGWETLVRRVGSWPFFAGGLALWFLAGALIVRQTLAGDRKPGRSRVVFAATPIAVLLLIVAFAASARWGVRHQAVVVAHESTLRAEPGDGADPEADVHEGLLVDVLGEREGWHQVRLPNGVRGWVPTNAVALIEH